MYVAYKHILDSSHTHDDDDSHSCVSPSYRDNFLIVITVYKPACGLSNLQWNNGELVAQVIVELCYVLLLLLLPFERTCVRNGYTEHRRRRTSLGSVLIFNVESIPYFAQMIRFRGSSSPLLQVHRYIKNENHIISHIAYWESRAAVCIHIHNFEYIGIHTSYILEYFYISVKCNFELYRYSID